MIVMVVVHSGEIVIVMNVVLIIVVEVLFNILFEDEEKLVVSLMFSSASGANWRFCDGGLATAVVASSSL